MKCQKVEILPWVVETSESHILTSIGEKREEFEKLVNLPSVPEMIFADNKVSIHLLNSSESTGIEFSALKALQLVDKNKISVEIPAAKDWRDTHMKKYSVFKPFDWTFSTIYKGCLIGSWRVENTDEGLDYDFLLSRQPIQLLANVDLFEDELGDNGISFLNIKIRVMKTGFFVLLRFFLRVDGSLLRVWDTRLQWRQGDCYILREVKRLDSKEWAPTMAGVSATEADQHCTELIEHTREKLFPVVSQLFESS